MWENDSETFRNDSETFRNDSETLRNDSETLRNDSESFRNDSETFRNDSETFRNDSQLFINHSETFINDSQLSNFIFSFPLLLLSSTICIFSSPNISQRNADTLVRLVWRGQRPFVRCVSPRQSGCVTPRQCGQECPRSDWLKEPFPKQLRKARWCCRLCRWR